VYFLVRRLDLERRVRNLGWQLRHHGGNHDVWRNDDRSATEYVPRHSEIHEKLARAILKRAEEKQ
jgi:predicted RNA binding protein YcfA (HicA-like mRNA interferase family)